MTGDADRRRTRSPLWMRGLLIVSLGLNLAVGGLVAGRYMRLAEDRDDRFAARILRLLPEQSHPAAREALAEDPQARRAARMARLRASLDALEAFRADPLDTGRLRATLEARREAMRRSAASRDDRIVALAETLDAEARAAFADRLTRRLRRRLEDSGPE